MRTAIAAAALAVAGVLAGGTCAVADAGAQGVAANSPGVLSGNLVQIPVHVPINVCGNTISVAGALNPASGTTCINS